MKKPYITVKAEPVGKEPAAVFVLLRGVLVELNSYSPYIAERSMVKVSLQSLDTKLPYAIGTDLMTNSPAVVLQDKNSISLGCQRFVGVNAKKLAKWAAGWA